MSNKYTCGTLDRRFEAMTIPEPNSGCLLWLGSGQRYGRISIGGDRFLAHRHAYERAYGPVPDGLEVCHSCDNGFCVNVKHLHLGTHKENMAEMRARKRTLLYTQTHCAHGHPFDDENTYWYRGYRRCKACRSVRWASWNARQSEPWRGAKRLK